MPLRIMGMRIITNLFQKILRKTERQKKKKKDTENVEEIAKRWKILELRKALRRSRLSLIKRRP